MARTVDPAAHARQRERILAAAATEFATQGYETTTTAAICRRAGIGSGTLFHYFPGKRDLLLALFADDLPRLQDLAARALAAGDPDVGLDLVIDHLVAEVSDPLSPGLAATVLLRAPQDAELASLLAEIDRTTQQTLTTLLRRIEKAEPGRLAFPPASAARWVRGVVDASHLGLVEGPRRRSATELRRVVGWLVGR